MSAGSNISLGKSYRVLVGIGVVIGAFVLLLISLTIYGLAHPSRHRALLVVLATFIVPIPLMVLVRKAGLGGLFKRNLSLDQSSAKGILLRNPLSFVVFPAYIPIILWTVLLFMIGEKELGDIPGWAKRNTLLIVIWLMASEVTIAYLFVTLHATYLGIYVASCAIYTAISIPVGGLSIEANGAVGFFGKYKNHASPLVVLSLALGCAGAFGVLHYAVWSLWPDQYINLHGIEDAMYFSVVTMATVGYGDILPIGHVARALCLLEIISGVVLLVLGVAASMTVWLEVNRPELEKGCMGSERNSTEIDPQPFAPPSTPDL
jgi:hypothetical protein